MDEKIIAKHVDREFKRLKKWYAEWPNADRRRYFVEDSEKKMRAYILANEDEAYRSLRTACENLSNWYLFNYEAVALNSDQLELEHFALAARYGEWAARVAAATVPYDRGAGGMLPDSATYYLSMAIVAGWREEAERLWQIVRKGLDTILLSGRIGNERNRATMKYRHFWFLLQLYADYRGHKLDVSPYYHPVDMTPFADVLANWRTPDAEKVTAMVKAMADFHVLESKDETRGDITFEFTPDGFRLFPHEIMTFLCLRQWAGLSSPDHYDHPLMQQPLANVPNEVPIPDTPLLNQVITKFNKEYPATFATG